LLTDPPYNVDYQGGTKAALKIKNDNKTDVAFRQFLSDAFCAAAAVLKPGGAFYIWHADSEGFNFRAACMVAALKVRQCLVWKKSTLVMGRQDYHWKHEPCLYGWKDGAGHKWFGGRKQTTVVELGDGSPFVRLSDGRYEVAVGERRFIVSGDATVEEFAPSVLEFDKPQRSVEHPTMKPVALFEYQMRNNTRVGDVVLDTFGGSGTTLIAAEKHERQARLMELDPKYCDVIVQRWQDFTGKAAVLESTGATFKAIKEQRV
jgi:DNA modification methylase